MLLGTGLAEHPLQTACAVLALGRQHLDQVRQELHVGLGALALDPLCRWACRTHPAQRVGAVPPSNARCCTVDSTMRAVPIFGTTKEEQASMSRNTSVSLGTHFDQFIAEQVDSGRYGSASEVVRAGLRLLESSEDKLAALRQLLAEGEQSGLSNYSYERLVADMDAQ